MPAVTRPLLLLAACAALAASMRGQASPLPSPLPVAMESSVVPPARWSARFTLPGVVSADSLTAYVGFENTGGRARVVVEWVFSQGTAEQGRSLQSLGTAYRPTAVCRQAGTTDVLFVAGWIDASGQAVVEKWTLEGWELGAGPVATDEPTVEPTVRPLRSTFSQPTVRRQRVYTSPGPEALPPIASLAANHLTDELWILTRADRRSIHTLRADDAEPDANTPTLVVDETRQRSLAQAVSLTTALSKSRGLILIVQPKQTWTSLAKHPYYLNQQLPEFFDAPPEEPTVVLFIDSDLDGRTDRTEERTYAEFRREHPPGSWDDTFTLED